MYVAAYVLEETPDDDQNDAERLRSGAEREPVLAA